MPLDVAKISRGLDVSKTVVPSPSGTTTIRDSMDELLSWTGFGSFATFSSHYEVPPEAKALVLHLENAHADKQTVGFIHPDGEVLGSPYNEQGCMFGYTQAWAIAALNDDLEFRAYREGTYVHALIVGYLGSDWTFPVVKTPLAHEDIGPQNQWYTKDLAGLVPADCSAVALEFGNHGDYMPAASGVRMYGSSDDRHGGVYHNWVIAPVTNQKIDLYFAPSSSNRWDCILLLGYCTGAIRGYVEGKPIIPVADDTYKIGTVLDTGHYLNFIFGEVSVAASLNYGIKKNLYAGANYERRVSGSGHGFVMQHSQPFVNGGQVHIMKETLGTHEFHFFAASEEGL